MNALAIIPAYNEADIIWCACGQLARQGIDVTVLDIGSTDQTIANAGREGACIIPAPELQGKWYGTLARIEDIAATSKHDWLMYQDADEIRYGPYGMDLLTAFADCEYAGCNVIDFQVATFHPTDNEYDGDCYDPEKYFTYYEWDTFNQVIGQQKAWKNTGQRVSLAASGGHRVQFPGKRVSPRRGLTKHYPIRSQQHGERKVFQERAWLDQQVRGRESWHKQYEGIRPGHNFLVDPAKYPEWRV